MEYLNDDNDVLETTVHMAKNDFDYTEELIIANDMAKLDNKWLVWSSFKNIHFNCVSSFSENLNYLDSSNISIDNAVDNV